ncbi:hypothetical protein LOD99_11456, partial [Oopsacas minuta]
DPFASFHYGIIPSYSFLSNAIITQTSTLYCVGITSTSSWTYTDLEGRSRPLTGTTGANAIVNVLEVKIDNPGTYSCEVTLADTSTEVFSVHLFPSSYTKPTTGCQAISSNGWCFNIELNFLTWDNAQQSCRSNGENLATVYSDIENDALSTLGSECWLGYNNLYNTLDTGRFSWIDGSPITYTRWLQDPTQPDNLDQEVATRVNSQKFWYDRPITQSACYFCGKYGKCWDVNTNNE